MNPNFLQIGNQEIAWYESEGPSTSLRRVSVLFIHGNSLSGRVFERQFDSPLGRQYRLIALDLPGHGASGSAEHPQTTYSLPGYASIVIEFARKLNIEDAVFVGWSLGGHILLEAAESLSGARGFMIFGAPPAGNPPDMAKAFLPSPAVSLLFKEELTEAEIDAWSRTMLDDPPASFAAAIRQCDGRARMELGKSIAMGNYSDEMRTVANLKTPLAVLHGGKDPLVNLGYIEALPVPTLWRGKVQVISGAGHAPHWDRPDAFNSLLESFL